MKKEMADALLEFYQKILKPEFDSIHQKLAEHDEKFADLSGHLDAIYRRLERLEDEQLVMNNRLSRIEDAIKAGNQNHQQLEKRVKEMKDQMAVLEKRLAAVEEQLNSSGDQPSAE